MAPDDVTGWWTALPEDERRAATDDYNERAAVMQWCGGMSRAEAEKRAGELVRKRYGAGR